MKPNILFVILMPKFGKYDTDNDCDCLIYDINNNTFSDNTTTYLSNVFIII